MSSSEDDDDNATLRDDETNSQSSWQLAIIFFNAMAIYFSYF